MKTVVIADDNEILLKQMKNELEKQSEIRLLGVANDGCEELELIKKTSPDIVVTDIEMPNMNGIKVIEEVKRLNIKTDFIITTGTISNQDIVEKISKLNVKSIIYKPCKLEKIIDEILKEEDKAKIVFCIENKSTSISQKLKNVFSKFKKKQS